MSWFSSFFNCPKCKRNKGLGFRRCPWCGNTLNPNPTQIQRALDAYNSLHTAAVPDVQFLFQHGSQKHYLAEAKHGADLGLFIDPNWVAVCTTRHGKELTSVEFLTAMSLWNAALEQWRNKPMNISDEKLRWRRWDELTFTVQRRLRLRPRYLAGFDKQSQLLTVAFFDAGDWCGYIPAKPKIPLTSVASRSATSSPPNT